MVDVDPVCGQCGKLETYCARVGGCCEACDHPFGEQPITLIAATCSRCGESFEYDAHSVGGRPKRCEYCREPGRVRPTIIPGQEYHWYVSYTGIAHLRVNATALSRCGTRAHECDPDSSPVESWETLCRKCMKHVLRVA